jgi:hypothetical protein
MGEVHAGFIGALLTANAMALDFYEKIVQTENIAKVFDEL